jgi:tripartite-type tricarboxylate transporter receptor subunit TctC
MSPLNRRQAMAGALLAAFALSSPAALAQGYPDRPVTLVVPFPPGGPTDVLARFVAQRLAERLGQPFVVENRPGALAMLGTDRVAKAAPDGYTLLLTPQSPITIVEHFEQKPPYQPATDLLPVAQVATSAVFVLGTIDGPRDMRAFAEQARAHPGKYSYGAPGLGNEMHLSWELIRAGYKLDVVPIPYQGTNPAVIDLMAGRVQVVLTSPSSVKGQLAQGKLRALATLTPKRLPDYPDVPTMAESGLDITMPVAWLGLLAPARTPPEVVARLRREFTQLSADPAYRQRVAELGFEMPVVAPEDFPASVARQRAQWGELIKAQNIRIQ